jgi:hypothetical protein
MRSWPSAFEIEKNIGKIYHYILTLIPAKRLRKKEYLTEFTPVFKVRLIHQTIPIGCFYGRATVKKTKQIGKIIGRYF